MYWDVEEVRPVGHRTLAVKFSDGLTGTLHIVFPPEMRTSRTTPALRATPPWPRRGKKMSGYHRERQ